MLIKRQKDGTFKINLDPVDKKRLELLNVNDVFSEHIDTRSFQQQLFYHLKLASTERIE